MENRKRQKSAHPLRPSEAREIQDEIFRKMSADRKIKLGSELTMFCLKLRKLGFKHKEIRALLGKHLFPVREK